MNFLIEDQSIRITTIQLEGRVDAFNAPQLRQNVKDLFSQGVNRIVFDLICVVVILFESPCSMIESKEATDASLAFPILC